MHGHPSSLSAGAFASSDAKCAVVFNRRDTGSGLNTIRTVFRLSAEGQDF